MIACDHKGYPIIGGHEFSQYKGAEFQDFHVVKVGLPWVVEAPKGYSCLFTAPFNRSGNAEAFCISGVVRCDRYYNMVSIPFAIPLKKKGDVMVIEKGTPICTNYSLEAGRCQNNILPNRYEELRDDR